MRGDDSNCDGIANGGCECIAGEQTTCGQERGSLGVCSARTIVCNNSGRWPAASACAPSSPEVCDNTLDDDCDGVVNEDAACDECTETCFCEDGACAELVDIDATTDAICLLTASGSVWCWGQNSAGQVGVPGFQNQLQPRRVDQVAGGRGIAVGSNATCALRDDQTVVCWGTNNNGQLGNNDVSDLSVFPVQVVTDANAPLSQITKIVSGNDFKCALRSTDGSVLCWGTVVGDGRTGGSPVAVPTLRSANSVLLGVGDIEAGSAFTLARAGASWVSWGSGVGGVLGQGDVNLSRFASAVLAQPNPSFVSADASSRGACASTAAGDVYCWGDEALLGGLGSGEVSAPARFPILDDTRSFALGGQVGLATDATGTLRAFGDADNQASGLGGLLTGDVPPTPIPGIGPVKVATVGGNFACAILLDDTVNCWGLNNRGQLGNGTTTSSVTPTPALPIRE